MHWAKCWLAKRSTQFKMTLFLNHEIGQIFAYVLAFVAKPEMKPALWR
jgi:hypothetical protein